jgi:excisionase family DNA binding protein
MEAPFTDQEIPVVGPALEEPLLTADDVARVLRVPRSSVYDYARRLHRPLPSMRIGRHLRFYRSEIEAWLVEQRASAVS